MTNSDIDHTQQKADTTYNAGDHERLSDLNSTPEAQTTRTPLPLTPLPIPPQLPFEPLRGVYTLIGAMILFVTAYCGSIFCVGLTFPLAILLPNVFRRIVDGFAYAWLQLAEVIVIRLASVNIKQFGDEFSSDLTTITLSNSDKKIRPRSSLTLLNHTTQLDWLFIWGLGRPTQNMKIVLKDSLARIPGLGWAMQAMSFLFLRRQITADKNRINTCIDYLLKTNRKIQLLMFPEGTNLCPEALVNSDKFARNSDLPFVRYTLHPRRTGFTYLVDLLGKGELNEVYDVTVAYPDCVPVPEYHIFLGKLPKEVHFHVRRYTSEELPWCRLTSAGDDAVDEKKLQAEQFGQWIQDRWSEKEEMLRDYYAKPIGSRRFENEVQPQSSIFRPTTDPTVGRQLTLAIFPIVILWLFLTLLLPYILFYTYLRYFAYPFIIGFHVLALYSTFLSDGLTSWIAWWA